MTFENRKKRRCRKYDAKYDAPMITHKKTHVDTRKRKASELGSIPFTCFR